MKLNSKNLPYLILVFAFVFLLLSLFMVNNVIDIHFHDTYIVIDLKTVVRIIALLFFIIWCAYFFFPSFLYANWLTSLHIVGTLITILGIIILLFTNKITTGILFNDYLIYKDWLNNSQTKVFNLFVGVFVVLQLLLPINLLLGFCFAKKSK